jgi:hypothetical protein
VTTFAFVVAERGHHAVATLCRIVGVSVSGFYAWLHAIPTLQSRAKAEADLRGHIGRIFVARRACWCECRAVPEDAQNLSVASRPSRSSSGLGAISPSICRVHQRPATMKSW